MGKTLWANCAVVPGYNEDTARYLKEHWGVYRHGLSEDELKKGGSP